MAAKLRYYPSDTTREFELHDERRPGKHPEINLLVAITEREHREKGEIAYR